MFFWFVIVAPVVVAEIFRSPMIDYRVVALGAALPLLEAVIGQAFVLHTMAAAIVSLVVVMLATQNRRLVRRRWLGIPIGLMMHLILGAVWASDRLFLWPAFGFSFDDVGVPDRSRPLAVWLLLELIGLGVGWWAWRRYELGDADNRELLLTTGQLNRSVLPS